MQVDVQSPPSVISPALRNIRSTAAASVTLSVITSGTPPLVHQWYLNNLPLANSDTPNLTLSPLHWSQRGAYKCVVSNAVGAATSAPIAVDLTSAAVVLVHPVDTKVARNGSTTLKVVAGGTSGITYQWLRNGQIIPKATKATLSLTKANDDTAGSYTVKVSNSLNPLPTESNAAAVVVENIPLITTQPLTHYGAVGTTHTFSVAIDPSSNGPLRYQWYKTKRIIAGATLPTLALTNLTAANVGSYHVVITNDVGKATSKTATLYVQTPPTITQDPTSLALYEYDKATFEVSATGSSTLTYQWHLNGFPIPKATARTYTIAQARLPGDGVFSHEGDYHCVVKNKVGNAESQTASLALAIVPPPTITSFSPGRGAPSDYVQILGTNFKWAKRVTFGGVATSHVIVSNNELRVRVPTGGKTGLINVQTHGGNASSSSNFTVSTGLNNDHFANAKLLFGSTVTASGNNTAATSESGEYIYSDGIRKTIWFRWQCPATAAYLFDFSRSIDHDWIANCWRGTTLSNLSYEDQAWSYYDSNLIWRSVPAFTLYAVKGAYYYIQFDGYVRSTSRTGTGQVYLDIKYNSSIAAPQSAPSMMEDLISQAGQDTTDVLMLRASFKTADSAKQGFSWTAGDGEQTAFSLEFDPADQSISWQWSGAEPETVEQLFIAGAEYDLELVFENNTRTWSAMLNGHWVVEDSYIPQAINVSALRSIDPGWTSPSPRLPSPVEILRHEVDSSLQLFQPPGVPGSTISK
jgi:hypothetical protein